MTFSKRIEVLISLGNKMLIFRQKGPILNFYQLTGLKLCWWQIQSNLSSKSQNCHHHILSKHLVHFSPFLVYFWVILVNFGSTFSPFFLFLVHFQSILGLFLVHFESFLVNKFGQIWPILVDLVRFRPIFCPNKNQRSFVCRRRVCWIPSSHAWV